MATVANGAHYSLRDSQVFTGNDFLLGPVLMAISIQPTGGVVSHIFTIIGYKHYRNFVANYTNPEYKAAVAQLPQARQGSEIFRGLAITLVKYFSDLPTKVRQTVHEYHLQNEKTNAHKYDNWRVLPAAFESEHAAALVAQLYPVEEPKKLIEDIECALTSRFLNWLDVDIVLRGGAYDNEEQLPQTTTRLINLFGEQTCLPSARLQRAPSSFTHSKHKSLVQNQDPAALEREVQELVATERNYVGRMNRLMDEIVIPMRKSARDLSYGGNFPSENELAQLFPACLDEIVRTNSVFAEDVDDALGRNGIEGVARVCLEHFPKFKRCYQEYLRTSPKFTQLFSQFSKRKADLFYKSVEVVGEQQFKSWLIDPVQRLPRYSLYIDNMLNHVDVGSDVFMNLNRARDIISEICSLQQSDSAERSQTIKRLQGIIPTWPIHLKPRGRLITAVDFYEILPPYNNETAECIASILLLFPDCIVILRRPNSTSLFARGIIAEVDRPASMKISSASKKDGIDLAFAGWCDLQDTRFAESDDNRTIWMEHIVDLSDNWTKGGEAGYRKLALYNVYEGKAVKFTEEVAQARLERRCANDPKGLIGIRRRDADGTYTSTWGALWGNEFDGYRQASWKGKYVIFIGEQPGSLEGSLKAELEDGYEVVIGIHALGVLRTIIVSDKEFWPSFSTIIRESFVEMSTMECEAGLRAPCIMSTNERLLRSFKVSYDGYNASRLTRRLRPGSPAKIFSSVFGTGSTQVGAGNSSPTKSSKPVLLVDQRTRLPPPGGKRTASGEASQQKITLVKDEREALESSGLNMFMRLEKTVELYLNGLRSVMTGYGFNIMAVPDKKQPLPDVPFEKQCEAHKLYAGFVDFIRAEWTEKIGSLVGRKVLDYLFDIWDSLSEFQDQFSEILSDMTPQNRRAFKNLMVLCHELVCSSLVFILCLLTLRFTA
ncbi:hypothetical protein L211DRAFT_889724 [Terfezia boudieri ATCC MYA-4762]|uniref:DH domain-containing protein n=1 Tax=Terfezia boudieri ATCC MYA-4762 TaxID=1051890 RepID=A0A3N4LF71_9PEZI|nr:hypothetical protein L211DRAFT_889724 [Terfezia boudieri ATCC MYA-4762]